MTDAQLLQREMDSNGPAVAQRPTPSEALVGSDVLGVLHVPPDYAAPRPGLRSLWRRHLVANASVRDVGYMTSLFRSHFPRGRVVEVSKDELPIDVIRHAGPVVLLYPDPLGLDAVRIERTLVTIRPAKHLLILNGRRRLFPLDEKTHRRLRLRRLLASTRIVEIAFLIVFIVSTPVLLVGDFIAGERQ